MRTQINKEELKKEWVITNWAEKTAYVIGFCFTAYLVICFAVGLVVGIAEAL
jgi:hypothetical protein